MDDPVSIRKWYLAKCEEYTRVIQRLLHDNKFALRAKMITEFNKFRARWGPVYEKSMQGTESRTRKPPERNGPNGRGQDSETSRHELFSRDGDWIMNENSSRMPKKGVFEIYLPKPTGPFTGKLLPKATQISLGPIKLSSRPTSLTGRVWRWLKSGW
jgi:hypothetical protein